MIIYLPVAIAVQCDHQRPIASDCQDCKREAIIQRGQLILTQIALATVFLIGIGLSLLLWFKHRG